MVKERERLRCTDFLWVHGFVGGIVAGTVFAVAQIVASVGSGEDPVTPIRMFASLALGAPALDPRMPIGAAVAVGLAVHYALSCAWGGLYSTLMGTLWRRGRMRLGVESLAGMAFGSMIWLVNFHVIGRLIFPWFLETPQFQQWVIHALFYGLPLGVTLTALERWQPTPEYFPTD
jgi:hypothetical protein